MNIQDFVEKMKKAQKMILNFIDNEVNEEDLNKFYEDYPQWKPKWMNNDQE